MLNTAPVERIKIGKRLLDKSRECLRRVFMLSYAYRTTGEEKYIARAEKELLAVAAFEDWNPTHFLDVAEMTMAVAIGYDWLFDKLSMQTRARLREATARTTHLGDELQALAERAALVHEQILDARGEQMNRTMLVLASVTVIAMPMTVVSGLLGMNVAGIPFAQSPEAFWIVVLALGVLGGGMVWFMRRRHWP